jgi:hypothetical protein
MLQCRDRAIARVLRMLTNFTQVAPPRESFRTCLHHKKRDALGPAVHRFPFMKGSNAGSRDHEPEAKSFMKWP